MCTTRILLFAIFANFVALAKLSDISWEPSKPVCGIPKHAVKGGFDTDGDLIYVGRTYHEGDILPCKIIPNKKSAYISFTGKEIKKDTYEVLAGYPFTWVSRSHGNVPHNAVPGGKTADCETLYIGRTFHSGSLTPGKIHPSQRGLYIAYNGKEYKYEYYEVLVVKK